MAKEEDVGIRNDQQQGKNSPRPWERQGNKTQRRNGALVTTDPPSKPSHPVLVCRNSAPEAAEPCWGTVPMAEEEQTLPSAMLQTAGLAAGGKLHLCVSVRCLSFWDFSPVSDGDKEQQSPVCCSTAALWKVCGGLQ